MASEIAARVHAENCGGPDGVTQTFQKVALPFAIAYSIILLILVSLQQAKLVSIDTATIELLGMLAAPWIIFAGIFIAVRIPGGGAIEFGRRIAETDAKVAETTARVDATKEEVERTNARLDRLYAYAMNNELYWHLKKLSGNDPGTTDSSHVFIPSDTNSGISAELNYLKLLDHVSFSGATFNDKRVLGVGDLPKGNLTWGELRKYITVTKNGLDYLAFREEIMKADAIRQATPSSMPSAKDDKNHEDPT